MVLSSFASQHLPFPSFFSRQIAEKDREGGSPIAGYNQNNRERWWYTQPKRRKGGYKCKVGLAAAAKQHGKTDVTTCSFADNSSRKRRYFFLFFRLYTKEKACVLELSLFPRDGNETSFAFSPPPPPPVSSCFPLPPSPSEGREGESARRVVREGGGGGILRRFQ